MKKIIPCLALAMLAFACGEAPKEKQSPETKPDYSQLEKLSWIIGSWENRSETETISESWTKMNDSTYSGEGLFVMNGDTLSQERITLEQRGMELFYVPAVKNQNEGKPVRFKMTSGTDQGAVFENPEHDFPQRIAYTRLEGDSVLAEISGMNRENLQSFRMARR